MTATTTEFRLTNLENRPYPQQLRDIIKVIENAGIGEDREDILAFALFLYNGLRLTVPSAEGLNARYEEHREAYVGDYTDTAEFAREFGFGDVIDVPPYIVIDWQATYDRNLRHDYFDYELITTYQGEFSVHRFIWRAL